MGVKSKKLITLVFVIPLVLFLGGCEKQTPQTPLEPSSIILLHIEGVITDETNGSPISDVSISLYESTGFGGYYLTKVYTNQDGQYLLNYSIDKEPRSLFRGLILYAEKSGYLMEIARVKWTAKIQIINFQLEPR